MKTPQTKTTSPASGMQEADKTVKATETQSAAASTPEVALSGQISPAGLVTTEVTRAESEFPPLTIIEVKSLRAANNSDERIAQIAASRGKKRNAQTAEAKPNLKEVIGERQGWLLEQCGHKPIFSGKVVGVLLVRGGYYPPLRGWNSMGDKMGGHGWELPSVVVDGAKRYDITYIGKTVAEIETRQQELNAMGLDVLRELVAQIPPEAPQESSESATTNGPELTGVNAQ